MGIKFFIKKQIEIEAVIFHIFPAYSTASKSHIILKKEEHDMIDSMVSNQIELKLQQTQLEAAMTKMELLDELKIEIDVLNPLSNEKNICLLDDGFGMPRISTVINLDELANQLHVK